jgi:hypothetical protein
MNCPKPQTSLSARSRCGYLLFELIIALSIFAIGVLALARSLNTTVESVNLLNRDARLRLAMRSFLEELRRKPLAEMSTSTEDLALGATLTSKTEPITLETTRSGALPDMHKLTITADYSLNDEARQETLEVYVYKPQ